MCSSDLNHEAKRRVRHKALSMMSKALNTWRVAGVETCIKNKWPQIPHGEWLEFVEYHSDESFRKKSDLMKELRSKNKMNHKLGCRGYLGKRRVWEKEDKDAVDAGKPIPFSYLEAGRAKDFVRARAKLDKVTWEPVFKSPVTNSR